LGYETSISGEFEITPKLPDAFVEKFNRLANMTDGSPACFAEEYTDGSPACFAEEYPADPPPEGIEGWCAWRLKQVTGAPWPPHECTRLAIGDGGEYGKFYGFEDWLVYAVRRIVRENPGLKFAGCVTWDGDDSQDYGQLEVRGAGAVIVSHGEVTYTEYERHPAP